MLLSSLNLSILLAQDAPLWLRTPSISPDGKTIVFSYKGDLYKVPTEGGQAYPLTLHTAHDYMPVWSKDGKHIAFSSNRYGNFDVFIIPAQGGEAKRLTYYSASDFPTTFTADNKNVIFTSSRLDNHKNMMFPSGALSEVYSVPSNGGRVKQVLTIPAEEITFNNKGDVMVFQDKKGYESSQRKHHTSSVTRDIWTYNTKTKKFNQIVDFKGEDRNPVFASDDNTIYYLSEKSGTLNIFKTSANGGSPTQITKYDKHPVRYLSIAQNGIMCYTYNGEIYTQKEGGSAKKVKIQLFADLKNNPQEIVDVRGGAREMAVSPNGKEVALIYRGEVFVTSVETGSTKRITNTPEQERNISFSPDGRAILYASERNNSWSLYQTKLKRDEEKYFFNSTILEEEDILISDKETFQASFSPDGKEVAYLEERTELKVINLKTKKSRVILEGSRNYSYADGDQHYQWSPDGKWFLVDFLPKKQWIGEVGLVSADGGKEVVNLTKSGYQDYRGKWMMKGKMMLWFSDKDGMKNQASWGAESDVYAMFFTQDAFDKFNMSKEEYKIYKEKKKAEKKDDNKEEEKDKKKEDKEAKEDKSLSLELEGIEKRKKRLTIHSSSLSDALVSNDGEKLYYLSRFEKGFNLWQTDLRTKQTKILTKLGSRGGSMTFDKDGKNIFLISSSGIAKIDAKSGKRKNIAFDAEMNLNKSNEREYMYEHMWRQVQKKFYLKDLHGVDWNFYKKEYARFLPHINNNYDYAEMMSELLGELNASHTGCYYRGGNMKNPDATASLGIYTDDTYTGKGIKITEIMDGSPLENNDSKIKAGVIIEKIDGQEIKPEDNYYTLLNRKRGENTLLSLYNEKTKDRWEETIKPVGRGQEFEMRYQRWVKRNEEMVKKLSNGKVGYVHVRGMDNESFKTVYEKALGENAQKGALIVDTRFNGGGWLHDDLATFLNGKKYLEFVPRGQELGSEPQFKWTKPSAVLMSESNYSDAHMFPYIYKELGIGKLIGMPVPGTGTAVWWENLQDPSLVFGIPQVGMRAPDGTYLENKELQPDVKVRNDYDKISEGEDQQLQKAVEELLKEIAEAKSQDK